MSLLVILLLIAASLIVLIVVSALANLLRLLINLKITKGVILCSKSQYNLSKKFALIKFVLCGQGFNLKF